MDKWVYSHLKKKQYASHCGSRVWLLGIYIHGRFRAEVCTYRPHTTTWNTKQQFTITWISWHRIFNYCASYHTWNIVISDTALYFKKEKKDFWHFTLRFCLKRNTPGQDIHTPRRWKSPSYLHVKFILLWPFPSAPSITLAMKRFTELLMSAPACLFRHIWIEVLGWYGGGNI